jgi:hypothetical protein
VAVDPRSPEHYIFAGTDYGLYYTLDGGITWQKEYSIPSVAVHEVKIRNSDRTLFAFTHGRGIWYLKLKDVQTSIENPRTFTAQISPNPVSNFVNVKSESPLDFIHIYNTNGQLVHKTNGNKEKDFKINLEALPKGVYFVQLISQNKQSTQRILKP